LPETKRVPCYFEWPQKGASGAKKDEISAPNAPAVESWFVFSRLLCLFAAIHHLIAFLSDIENNEEPPN
jgi:hypothetical protein